MNQAPIVRDVLLVGGGHSHVLLIREWAMRPLAGVRLTLVSRDTLTPYSGMLPGLVAGHYRYDEVHIDLLRLCAWAGVRFIEADMTALDLASREATLADRPSIGFDVLSLDTGSTPDLSVPGAARYSTPVKPVAEFHARWLNIKERLTGVSGFSSADTQTASPLRLGVVGSGAGGFELVTAMRHALPTATAECHWFLRGSLPLGGRPEAVGRRALAAARDAGVQVHAGFDVIEVKPQAVLARDGREQHLDELVWCTGATGPDWPAHSGLATDARGFVETRGTLQSTSHDFVFATGDIGTQRETPSNKAGVYAVRQAPVLLENLQRYLLGTPLKTYRPQRDFLSLMAIGERRAIASRGPLVLEGATIWRWKNYIDQSFMRRFSELPAMPLAPAGASILPDALQDGPAQTRCQGCGSKVGEPILEEVLAGLEMQRSPGGVNGDALDGLSVAGDVAVLGTGGDALVQSVDQLNAIIDDPYLFGRIATLHALSDIHTVAAVPHSVQVIASVRHGSPAVVRRELSQLMQGVVDALEDEQCALAGGHTTESPELTLSLVANAWLRQSIKRPSTPGHGDRLLLTQPLGTGILFAGLMQRKSHGRHIRQAVQQMLTSNRQAGDTLRAHGARCMTDVTGFGLLGHLARLCNRGDSPALTAHLQLPAIPLLPGARWLAENGVQSTLWQQNATALEYLGRGGTPGVAWQRLLCDPQTSGGLLAVIPADSVDACRERLQAEGYADAAIIGRLASGAATPFSVVVSDDPLSSRES